MEFRLLGEVQLLAGDLVLDIGTPRQQAVLAALAVDAGRPVPLETLVDRVWHEGPPAEARNVLYSHLSRIRRLLERAERATGVPAHLRRRAAGYVLEVDPAHVDLHRFTDLADRDGTARERADALTDALSLWRGPPLSGVRGKWAAELREIWRRRRLDAVVRWGALQLELGHPETVLAALPDLLAEHPLAEPLDALYLRALHARGRDAEALEHYAVLRRRLADELGADPGPELRALHTALLRGELPAPARASPLATPAQLPPDVFGFAGRDTELGRLDDLVASGARIVVVSGMAGVGKTSLVVHWAQRSRADFPGGQLYVNLRGFDPTGAPVSPAEAVRGFLDAFEVPVGRIPASADVRVGLLRSLLADRRVLVVLDNARDAEQVRPLLPGAPGCVVLVTSRDPLAGLVTAGARPLTVDLPAGDEAARLLAGRLGADRVAAEPAAAREIVELCARLPLALAVVAARAAAHPTFPLSALAHELREARGSLDEFAGADPATDPRAVFSWSYLRLSPPAARLFRLFGLHAGPDVSARAAASLAGLAPGAVRPLLSELAQARLVAEHAPARYTCHDLLRAYASEQTAALDPPADRADAVRRLLAHYTHTANAADHLLDPAREDPPGLTPLPPDVQPESAANQARALAWFDAERRTLLSALHQPPGHDAQVWELAWTMRRFLAHQGHWHDEIQALTLALAAAERLDDPSRQAYAHCYLGCTHVWLDDYGSARTRLHNALDLYGDAGDEVGQGYVHYYLAWMLERQGRNGEALAHAQAALALYEDAGHLPGQAKARNAIGWFHALLGDHPTAVEHCEKALALQMKLGDLVAIGQTWHSLGYVHGHLGDHDRAIACYQTALGFFRESGYRYGEAMALVALGDSHFASGTEDAARDAWGESFEILRDLDHSDADDVRVKLAKLEEREDHVPREPT
jgi:DNA-binding SARP family transcriptional activator/tetratricopeptide (TPR) repeat protein